ncbi:MAG TPA: VOC family protein [Phycisphaerae bacterium]|jgi:catechol 2,3-dioxygenase-like lactoylglutathione lyase family enzyme|nr:VOC family protein [Phycisphaerae bacterium]
MFELDHVAIQVPDVPAAARFYQENFGAQILYADQTWAFLRLGQGKLALVRPEQHPPHVALRVDAASLEAVAAKAGLNVDLHRDGTRGIYIKDPAGNTLELICYPPGQTAYEKTQ